MPPQGEAGEQPVRDEALQEEKQRREDQRVDGGQARELDPPDEERQAEEDQRPQKQRVQQVSRLVDVQDRGLRLVQSVEREKQREEAADGDRQVEPEVGRLRADPQAEDRQTDAVVELEPQVERQADG